MSVRGFTKFGIKVLWSLQFLGYFRTLSWKLQFAETANRADSGQLQFWSEPSEILNLGSSNTSEPAAFTIPWYLEVWKILNHLWYIPERVKSVDQTFASGRQSSWWLWYGFRGCATSSLVQCCILERPALQVEDTGQRSSADPPGLFLWRQKTEESSVGRNWCGKNLSQCRQLVGLFFFR